MDYTTIIEAATPLIVLAATTVVQYFKSKDTNAHGDSFINMLKGAQDSLDKVAVVFPQVAPAVAGYKSTVAQAEKIWNSGGFTANDIQVIEAQAAFFKSQIDAAVVAARTVKVP